MDAEVRAAKRYLDAWIEESTKLERTVGACARNKTSPGEHYWQAEREARLKARIAVAVIDVLNGG